MSRAERLVNLVNLILNRGAMHVHEMAVYCDVNERTIYRDMGALSRMGIPVYYKNGYRIMSDSTSPVGAVTHLDLDVLCLAVCNSTLTKSPYFRSRLKMIIEKLQVSKRQRTPTKEQELVVYDRKSMAIPAKYENSAILDFLKAALERKWIRITGLSGQGKRITCIPVAVKLLDNSAHLVVARDEMSEWEMIPLTRNVRIHVTKDSFSHRPTKKG
jgi:predicted DNA-binding transcriptional regulator YafY